MKKILFVIIFIALTSCGSNESPQSQLIGKWQCVLLMDGGRTAPEEVVKSVTWDITVSEINVSIEGNKEVYPYTLNTESEPWTMDMQDKNGKKPILSILKIEDGFLYHCASEAGKSHLRPTAFESVHGSVNDILFKLKKVK